MDEERDFGPAEVDVRFWLQILADSRKVIVCHPDLVERVRAELERTGTSGLIEVQTSSALEPTRALVIDLAALGASQEQFLQHLWRTDPTGEDTDD